LVTGVQTCALPISKTGSKATGKVNATREVIWFSPHCHKPDGNVQLSILDGLHG
jgi:hypothetical protein